MNVKNLRIQTSLKGVHRRMQQCKTSDVSVYVSVTSNIQYKVKILLEVLQ